MISPTRDLLCLSKTIAVRHAPQGQTNWVINRGNGGGARDGCNTPAHTSQFDAPAVAGTALGASAAAEETSAIVNLTALDPDSDNSDPATLTYDLAPAGIDVAVAIGSGAVKALLGQIGDLGIQG